MNETQPVWHEEPLGGSMEAESRLIERLAQDMLEVQHRVARKSGKQGLRTLHAKILAGIENARLEIDADLPPRFAVGYFQPGAICRTTVRFSNASFHQMPDTAPDMRGVALRIHFAADDYHDLLMTSYPVSHARNAEQFVTIMKIVTGPKLLVLPRLLFALGPAELRRVAQNIKAGSVPTESLALQQFWSRAPLLWGPAGPVRYTLRPVQSPGQTTHSASAGPNYLTSELTQRLLAADVRYRLALQPYIDARRTPIEDGAVEWKETDSAAVEVATLVIPAQDLHGPTAIAQQTAIDATLAFNPWNCPTPFRPLGNLNRARARVYWLSAQGWLNPPR